MFKIRYRERRNASPKEGQRNSWGEYQVVEDGRKIIARFDTLPQAQREYPGAVYISDN